MICETYYSFDIIMQYIIKAILKNNQRGLASTIFFDNLFLFQTTDIQNRHSVTQTVHTRILINKHANVLFSGYLPKCKNRFNNKRELEKK